MVIIVALGSLLFFSVEYSYRYPSGYSTGYELLQESYAIFSSYGWNSSIETVQETYQFGIKLALLIAMNLVCIISAIIGLVMKEIRNGFKITILVEAILQFAINLIIFWHIDSYCEAGIGARLNLAMGVLMLAIGIYIFGFYESIGQNITKS